MAMDAEGPVTVIREETALPICRCPFLQAAAAEWLWPVEGICRARADGRLMVPPVFHYLHLCVTGDHHLCEVYRARGLALQSLPGARPGVAGPGQARPALGPLAHSF